MKRAAEPVMLRIMLPLRALYNKSQVIRCGMAYSWPGGPCDVETKQAPPTMAP